MATTMRASSFLPTITCSLCAAEIPISQMGEHACSADSLSRSPSKAVKTGSPLAALRAPESGSRTLDGPFIPSARVPMGHAPSSLRSGKAPIVPNTTEKTSESDRSTAGSGLKNVLQVEEIQPPPRPPFTSTINSTSSGRTSPASSLSGRKSPFRKMLRVATAPLIKSAHSPDAMPISQDSAFPIFPTPTARSRSATSTTPRNKTFGNPFETKEENSIREVHPLSSSQLDQEENPSKQTNNISSEPFNAQGMEVRRPSGAENASAPQLSQSLDRSASTSTTKSRVRAFSTSSSNYTRNPSMASIPGYTRLDLVESDVPAVPTVPSVALDYSPVQTQGENPMNRYTSDASPFDFGSYDQTKRSKTFPEDGKREESSRPPSDPTHINLVQEEQSTSQAPSEAPEKTHKSKPSIMLPLFDIGSTSSFRPSKSLRGRRNRSPTIGQLDIGQPKAVTPQEDKRLEDAPPVPQPMVAQFYDISNPYHTPHESVSSNDSYGSGVKSSSSRSSPPLNSPLNNASPQKKGSHESNGFHDAFQGFQFGVEGQPELDRCISPERALSPPISTSAPSQTSAPLESQEPSLPDLSSPPRSIRPHSPPESQHRSSPPPPPPKSSSPPRLERSVKPAPAPLRNLPTRPMLSPMTSPEDYLASPTSPFIDLTRNIRVSPGLPPPPPIPEAPARKRTPVSKGKCRGCHEDIYGKSISSADGQLTGRYHKQCFVCKTCSAPFQTTDFYVYKNNPYCGRHYHEQNGSLCTSCDRGIEGQYLETDHPGQKFHPYCFTCQDCHRILRDEFYEWNNRILCEQHAFGGDLSSSSRGSSALQPSSLGPGRRYPERRTTKLMNM